MPKELFKGQSKINIMDNIKDIFDHITDRTQKLTAALYRVTDLLSDKEPLKWTLRDKALVIHDNLVIIRKTKDKNGLIFESVDLISAVTRSLELAAYGVCVSSLNFEILKREYSNLKNFIEGKKEEISYDPELLSGISASEKIEEKSVKNFTEKRENSIPKESLRPADLFAKRPALTPIQIDPKSRKGRILDLLKGGAGKTVNEIASVFTGETSEKSIQRDLLDLVKHRKVLAIGDKRWRKYEIIKENTNLEAASV
ncbi:hypothetical protein C4572_00840 [Candidatus Parcubacteria bacterium]|nr:MAG: hypothetical protein C4572_00840 [Candidatus Parcubacteria bacterium]